MRFLKNLTIGVILIVVLAQTFAIVGFIVQFESNSKYYATVLCINKSRPELACNGKCILMQRLNRKFEKTRMPPIKLYKIFSTTT